MKPPIQLDFKFNPTRETRWLDYSVLDRSALHKAAQGDLLVVVAGCDFSARWGWISAVYCADVLFIITDGLARYENPQYLDFLENEDVLKFDRMLRQVRVTSSYAPGEAMIQLWDLIVGLRKFSKRVIRAAARDRSGLLSNPVIREILAKPLVPTHWADAHASEKIN